MVDKTLPPPILTDPFIALNETRVIKELQSFCFRARVITWPLAYGQYGETEAQIKETNNYPICSIHYIVTRFPRVHREHLLIAILIAFIVTFYSYDPSVT